LFPELIDLFQNIDTSGTHGRQKEPRTLIT